MTSNLRATLFLGTYGASGNNQDARLSLIKLLDEHAEEQRQECADKVHDCLQNYGIRQDAIYDASEACLDACLDATGENNV